MKNGIKVFNSFNAASRDNSCKSKNPGGNPGEIGHGVGAGGRKSIKIGIGPA